MTNGVFMKRSRLSLLLVLPLALALFSCTEQLPVSESGLELMADQHHTIPELDAKGWSYGLIRSASREAVRSSYSRTIDNDAVIGCRPPTSGSKSACPALEQLTPSAKTRNESKAMASLLRSPAFTVLRSAG